MATETPNNIAILSQKRQEQVSFFNVCLLGELHKFPREIMVKLKLKSQIKLKLSLHLLKGKHFFLFYVSGDR